MAPRPQNQKRRPESARRANRIIQTRTLLLLGAFGVLTFVLLFTKLYHWQITEHDELQSVAVRQQTLRTTSGGRAAHDLRSKRHHPRDVRLGGGYFHLSEGDHRKRSGSKPDRGRLAEILDLDPADILKKMEKTNSQYEELKKKADDELADKVREFINENDLKGVFHSSDEQEDYPKGTLASQVIALPMKTAVRWALRRRTTTS